MSTPIQPPGRKSPQQKTILPTRPPGVRSRAALGLTIAAARGQFNLQSCSECHSLQYPPRDACASCLCTELAWVSVNPAGTMLAETTVRASTHPYFRERLPFRIGTIQLDAGPIVIAHVHADCACNARVSMINRLDRSGQGVLIALPTERQYSMEDDPQLRSMSCTPKHRRILITDARNPNTEALSQALLGAGASQVFVGDSETWLPHPNRAALEALDNVTLMPLDVSDTSSVQKLAAQIGGKTDILVNNAHFIRPGNALTRSDTAFAKEEMEINYFGLMRLAQAFGPAMCSRTADGINSAVSWVNVLSVHSVSNSPNYGCFSASSAAARSLSQSLRAEFREAGLRVLNIYCGPTDEEWYQSLPPPKVSSAAMAKTLITSLIQGLEEACCGDVARDVYQRFCDNPHLLERELTAGDGD